MRNPKPWNPAASSIQDRLHDMPLCKHRKASSLKASQPLPNSGGARGSSAKSSSTAAVTQPGQGESASAGSAGLRSGGGSCATLNTAPCSQ